VAGSRGWREQAIFQTVQRLGLEQAVHFPGFIDDEDLPAVYGGALCFVFPSLYEGFGLPILEAMGCGTPVITSNVAAIPEVAGDAALLIDPQDVEGIAAAMSVLVHNDTIRERLRQKGFIQAQQFSWATTAQKTLALYRSLGG